MKEIIKKHIGWVGFIIAVIMIFVGYYNAKSESLTEFGFFLWLSTWTIDMELNKPKPKIWYIYLVTTVTLFVFTLFFLK